MHPFENLGLALRWLRNRRNRTQLEVARAAGVTKAMLSSYETGKCAPSIDTLGKLLGALQIDLRDLQDALDVQRGQSLPDELGASVAGVRRGRPN